MLFIPLPKLPFIHIAPINLVILVLSYLLIFRLKDLVRARASVKLILFSLVIFCISDFVINTVASEGDPPTPPFFRAIRGLVILSATVILVKSMSDLKVLVNWVLFGIIFSALVGLLVHFFGGGFQDFRNWMLQDSDSISGISGKGIWVSGLSGNHFTFGYLLAGGTILPLIYAALEKRMSVWFIVYFVFIVALILNAERSAAVAVFGSNLYFAYKCGIFKNKVTVIAMIVGIILIVGMQNYRHSENIENKNHALTSAERFENSDDVFNRIMWQFHGIQSVLEYPVFGPSTNQYRNVVLGSTVTKNSLRMFIPYPHNHYINIGMHIGILGWALLLAFMLGLLATLRHSNKMAHLLNIDSTFIQGINIALGAAMFNALFHNAGIFFFESMTLALLAITLGIASWLSRGKAL
jgi:O-Antigen ligase